MRVFISSVITGYEPFRDAVAAAVESLDGEVVRAEDFGAIAATPQQVCLGGVRSADVVVLLLGSRYGAMQPSGFSATEEEYREARSSKPVLIFVESVLVREERQEAFLREVQGWASGHMTEEFADPESLRTVATRQLNRFQRSQLAGAADSADMLDRAKALLADDHQRRDTAQIVIAVAGAPRQAILRPSQIESDELYESLLQQASFGPDRVLSSLLATQRAVREDALLLSQDDASVLINEEGSVRVAVPARDARSDSMSVGLPVVIEEEIQERLILALSYMGWALHHVDPTNRLTRVALATCLRGSDFLGWRTRAEHARNRGSVSISLRDRKRDPVSLSPPDRPRETLVRSALEIAEDLTIRLRRQRG